MYGRVLAPQSTTNAQCALNISLFEKITLIKCWNTVTFLQVSLPLFIHTADSKSSWPRVCNLDHCGRFLCHGVASVRPLTLVLQDKLLKCFARDGGKYTGKHSPSKGSFRALKYTEMYAFPTSYVSYSAAQQSHESHVTAGLLHPLQAASRQSFTCRAALHLLTGGLWRLGRTFRQHLTEGNFPQSFTCAATVCHREFAADHLVFFF